MDGLVVYESLYGNTAAIAHAIGEGLTERGMASQVVPVDEVRHSDLVRVRALIVGGPTHAHGLSKATTRATAAGDDANVFEDPTVEPGLRAWLKDLPDGNGRSAAVFDTRFRAPAFVTGSAAKGIAQRIERRGYQITIPPESFFVTKHNTLVAGELERAKGWGAVVVDAMAATL
jgi:hypothetical protein